MKKSKKNTTEDDEEAIVDTLDGEVTTTTSEHKKKKKKKRKREQDESPTRMEASEADITQEVLTDGCQSPIPKKKKEKKKKKDRSGDTSSGLENTETSEEYSSQGIVKKSKKHKKNIEESSEDLPLSPQKVPSGVDGDSGPAVTEAQSPTKPDTGGTAAETKRTKPAIPKSVLKLQQSYLESLPENDKPSTAITKENIAGLTQNWRNFCEEHPYPYPARLLRLYLLPEEEKVQAKAFIKSHKLYKALTRGVSCSPLSAFRCARDRLARLDRLEKGRKDAPRPSEKVQIDLAQLAELHQQHDDNWDVIGSKMNLQPELVERHWKKTQSNKRGRTLWTDEESASLREAFRKEYPRDLHLVKAIRWSKVAAHVVGKPTASCSNHWRQQVCWTVNAQCQLRPNPFTDKEKLKLIRRVKKQHVSAGDEIKWTAMIEKFEGCTAEDLQYYWLCLTSQLAKGTSEFSEILQKLDSWAEKAQGRVSKAELQIAHFQNMEQRYLKQLETLTQRLEKTRSSCRRLKYVSPLPTEAVSEMKQSPSQDQNQSDSRSPSSDSSQSDDSGSENNS